MLMVAIQNQRPQAHSFGAKQSNLAATITYRAIAGARYQKQNPPDVDSRAKKCIKHVKLPNNFVCLLSILYFSSIMHA